jgi:Cu/Ag efflux protein CusF
VVVALALTPVATTHADAPLPGETPPGAQKQIEQEISGTISAIDVSARIIRLSGAFANKTFKVGPYAQIVISRIPEARLNDLKVGDQVDISYHEQDGAFVASHITRVESKPPPAEY